MKTNKEIRKENLIIVQMKDGGGDGVMGWREANTSEL